MRRTASLFLAGLVILSWGALSGAGDFVALRAGQIPVTPEDVVRVSAAEGASDAITLEYDLAGFEMSPVVIDGRTYQALQLGEESHLLEAGVPELPTVCRSVIIPDRARMEVRVVSASYQDFSGIDVAPSKGNLLRNVDPAAVPFEFGPAYAADEWFPAEIAVQREPYILRDLRGTVVVLSPIQYHPQQHLLRVYDHIVIELVPVGEDTVNILDRPFAPAAVSGEFFELYGDHFVNFGLERYAPISEVGEMLVIAYDDFMAGVQPFVDWKNQMGIPTTLVAKSTVGTTGTQFQTYIRDYYNTHDLAFVLLVGDATQIPYLTNGGAPADPMYALVAGGDNYPDLFIGRFSAENTSQVNLQVLKSVEYESAPVVSHWYRRGVGIGSGEGAGIGDDGEADWQHINNIRTDLVNFTYTGVDTIYAYGGYPSTAQAVANAVNHGRSIINYCGHGWTQGWSTTGFSNTHVAQLVNHNMLPWIISVACVNGAFHSGTCFAESWLRAERDGEPTGAVGMYASTVNMSWAPPMAAQDESVDLLVANAKRTMGALCYSGSCRMMDEYGGGASEFKNWHIFGDPSLRVRSATPTNLTVQHEAFIEAGATTFTVTVPGVSGALCGLSDGGQYLGSAFTNASGVAVIDVVGTLPADAVTLTATYFNKFPYVAELEVGQPALPDLLVDPLEFVFDVPLEETQVDYLSITNAGMDGSTLTYNLMVMPSAPNMWLRVSPQSGACGADETDVIDVTVDTHGLRRGIYTAKILVVSNAREPVNISVTLFAGGFADVDARGVPAFVSLQAAGPNPFGARTRVSLGLPQSGAVRLGVYDLSGRLVRTLADGGLEAGYHHYEWDGCDESAQRVSGGVYLYRLNAAGKTLTEKVLYLR